MTLDEAKLLEEKWKKKHLETNCEHKNLYEPLTIKTGRHTGYVVCLECGRVYPDPHIRLPEEKPKTFNEIVFEDSKPGL